MQARSLTEQEINTAVSYAMQHTGKWALRNRMLLLLSHWTGMRVCEIASLRVRHVLDVRGEVLADIAKIHSLEGTKKIDITSNGQQINLNIVLDRD